MNEHIAALAVDPDQAGNDQPGKDGPATTQPNRTRTARGSPADCLTLTTPQQASVGARRR
jgi:hypothetical protein